MAPVVLTSSCIGWEGLNRNGYWDPVVIMRGQKSFFIAELEFCVESADVGGGVGLRVGTLELTKG